MNAQTPDCGEWLGFAKKLASKYVTPGVDLEDLEQEAMLAVIENIAQYDSDIGVSLRVFLGRRVQDRLRSMYRKTLNIVQVEQYWAVIHVSGDPDQNVRADSKEEAEAVLRLRPADYVRVKNVKVHAPIGPSLDMEIDSEIGTTLHELVGEEPEQEWRLSAKRRVGNTVNAQTGEASDQLATILTMRLDGFSFGQIGECIGKSPDAAKKMWQRAQKASKTSKGRAA